MKIHQLLEMPIEPTGDPNDPTVYGHERANPMSLKGRIQQARNQLQELAKASESDDLVVWESICKKAQGGMFMGLEQNLEQIRHGIEELAQRRRKGGVNARGIDKNIGEAKGPAQQAAIAIAMKKAGKKPKGVAEGYTDDDIETTKQFRNAIAGLKAKSAIDKAKDGDGAKYYSDGAKVTPQETARRAAERKAEKDKKGKAEGLK